MCLRACVCCGLFPRLPLSHIYIVGITSLVKTGALPEALLLVTFITAQAEGSRVYS